MSRRVRRERERAARGAAAVGAGLGQQCLDLGIGVPARRALTKDQVRAHAAAREVFDAFVVFRAVRVGVEMPWTLIADVLEELDEPEGGFHVGGSETKVLIVAAGRLVVQ